MEHSGISTDILLFSELGLLLTQHYREYRGGLPHTMFHTDYIERLQALLPPPRCTEGEPASAPETGRGATPRSAKRLHRCSQMSEAVDDGPLLTVQNPTDMVGETVINCRPSVLPVSMPLSALSPRTVDKVREISGFNPPQETGQSIIAMDTNEITINRIVGFQWDEPGTEVEDELPTPTSSPAQNVAPVIPPTETADSLDRGGDGFRFRLGEGDVRHLGYASADLADRGILETVIESPGYAVPGELTFSWVLGYVPVPGATGRHFRKHGSVSPDHAVAPRRIWCQLRKLRVCERLIRLRCSSPSIVMCQGDRDSGPDLTREGPFDVYEVPPEPGQLPLVLNSMPGCQFRMTSYDDRDSRADLDPAYGIHLHDPRMMEYMGAPESACLLCQSPKYWLEHMGRDRAVAAALWLHNDASLIMTNVQVMAQFVTSLNRTASEVMRMVYDKEPFPTDAVQFVTPGRRVRLAAHYMAVMGLWHPTSGPVFPGPIPVSSCNSCMSCEDCFPDVLQ